MTCKWMADNEICVNANSPVCCDYCPVAADYFEICKHAELVTDDDSK